MPGSVILVYTDYVIATREDKRGNENHIRRFRVRESGARYKIDWEREREREREREGESKKKKERKKEWEREKTKRDISEWQQWWTSWFDQIEFGDGIWVRSLGSIEDAFIAIIYSDPDCLYLLGFIYEQNWSVEKISVLYRDTGNHITVCKGMIIIEQNYKCLIGIYETI